MALLLNNKFFHSIYRVCHFQTRFLVVRHLSSVSEFKNKFFQNHRPILTILGGKYRENYTLRNIKVCFYSKSSKEIPKSLATLVQYENVSEETMQSLYERFEEVLQDSKFEDSDVNYSNGVLTAAIEDNYTYVINKQTPNRQIWLSSPISGPKRYDYIDGTWIYKHDGIALHKLLSEELTDKLQTKADFMTCSFSK